MDFVEELTWRGMLHQMSQGADEKLSSDSLVGYCGFDPSAPSLQVGNLAAIMMMKHFQRAGHKPIAVVGGATGIIGDPSGKSSERNLLSREEVEHNLTQFKKQLNKFLDFDTGKPNAAEIVNNYDWFKDITFLDFLRDVGKHLTINYMMSKDSVQNRLESGLSYAEFSYQLLQAYDYYHLHSTKNVNVQFGGSDQWGNITSGTELIRRMGGGEAFAVTAPLVTRADGTKFGKSADGQKLWLDPAMTSPYQFYQFWLNVEDQMAERYLKVFTLLRQEEINTLIADHAKAPHTRIMQKRLAQEVTTLVHSAHDCTTAIHASEILFGNATSTILQSLSEQDFLAVFEGVPRIKITRSECEAGVPIVDFSAQADMLFSSKGDVRRAIKASALSINKEKISDETGCINTDNLLNNRYILIQKGKKNYAIFECE